MRPEFGNIHQTRGEIVDVKLNIDQRLMNMMEIITIMIEIVYCFRYEDAKSGEYLPAIGRHRSRHYPDRVLMNTTNAQDMHHEDTRTKGDIDKKENLRPYQILKSKQRSLLNLLLGLLPLVVVTGFLLILSRGRLEDGIERLRWIIARPRPPCRAHRYSSRHWQSLKA